MPVKNAYHLSPYALNLVYDDPVLDFLVRSVAEKLNLVWPPFDIRLLLIFLVFGYFISFPLGLRVELGFLVEVLVVDAVKVVSFIEKLEGMFFLGQVAFREEGNS